MSGGSYEYVMGVMIDNKGILLSGQNGTLNAGFVGPCGEGGTLTKGFSFPEKNITTFIHMEAAKVNLRKEFLEMLQGN